MNKREIPRGFRDLLPEEVKRRRRLEKKAVELFQSFGYEEVITPLLEFLEVVETGAGGKMREQLFLLMDREGGILSLRPEMTVSIARLAASHLQEASFPQRLFYKGNVFRHVQSQLAQYREFEQIGIEMLGASGPWADAEVIGIAVRLLSCLGLDDFKISLNHIGIFNSLIDHDSLQENDKDLIKEFIENKDLVELERLLDKLPIENELKDTIIKLPVLHGDLDILKKLPYLEKNLGASRAVNELIKVYEALQAHGVAEHIVIDMGVIRGLNYYTGIVFEGYSPRLGYGLLGGGRYDRLMEQFGLPRPATGFALGMDRLALILEEEEENYQRYLIAGQDLPAMINKAEALRAEGKIVVLDLQARNYEEAIVQSKNTGNVLVYVEALEKGGDKNA